VTLFAPALLGVDGMAGEACVDFAEQVRFGAFVILCDKINAAFVGDIVAQPISAAQNGAGLARHVLEDF
jgi:hypothetical protein